MRCLVLITSCALAGCLDFGGLLDARCADGGLSGCPSRATGGGSSGGGSATGGGATTGGGTATGGGIATGGGTATGGGLAGTDAGVCTPGVSSVVTAGIDGGFCSSDGWCWERPMPFGNDINVLWGSSSTDLWAAGAGRLLARWNGLSWVDESGRLPSWETPPDNFQALPIFVSSATTDAGTTWLLDNWNALFEQVDGGFVRRLWGVTSMTTWRGALYYTTARDNGVGHLRVWGSPDSLHLLTGDWLLNSLIIDDSHCLASGMIGTTGDAVLVNCKNDSASLLGYGYAAEPFQWPDTHWRAGGVQGVIYSFDSDGGWDASFPSNLKTSLYGVARLPDAGIVGVGEGSTFYDVSADRLTTPWSSNSLTLNAAWASPQGEVWAAGYGGNFGSRQKSYGPNEASFVTALAATEYEQVAVTWSGDLFQRHFDGWGRIGRDTAPKCDVALVGNEVWWVTPNVEVRHFSLDGGSMVSVDAGVRPLPDMCPILRASASGLALALDSQVVQISADGVVTSLPPIDGGHVVGVADVDCRLHVAANFRVDGGMAGAVFEYDQSNRSWRRSFTREEASVSGLARASTGFWVTGERAYAAHIVNGNSVEHYKAPEYANEYVIGAYSSQGVARILFAGGAVLSHIEGHPSDDWVRELVPWSAPSTDALDPFLITGNSSRVFVTGSRTAILSHPVK